MSLYEKEVIKMLEKLRWKVAAQLAKKAAEETSKGEFENIVKGLKYLKTAIMVAPPDKKIIEFGNRLRKLANKYSNEKGSC